MKSFAFNWHRQVIITSLLLLLLVPAVSGAFQHEHAPDYCDGSTHVDNRAHHHHDLPIRETISNAAIEWVPIKSGPLLITLNFPDLTDPVFSIDQPPEASFLHS